MKTPREFKNVLKEYLHDNGLTQVEFARLTAIDPKQINKWVKGKSAPHFLLLQQICTALNISADYFLGLSDSY
ncbi:MAG: helix-turn-helix transcriptional regulator [Clostridia bacterium]|nr:helix-turn-helix transcriptional regulator [Clostridia bacterium]